jgi:Kdo2-lipid IVA lauroyltransferase/acyltransferase
MAIKQQLTRLALDAVILAGRMTSPALAMRAAGGFARRFKLDPRLDKRQLRKNLTLFFPDRDPAWVEATAREVQANALTAKLLDKHFLPRLPMADLERVVEVDGLERLRSVLDSGRGAVLATMHYGRHWSLPVWLSRHGYDTTGFQAAEGHLPMAERTLSGGSFNANDPRAALRAVRALKSGTLLFLVLDGGKVANPITTDFVGHPTRFSTAPLRLARAAGSAVVPVVQRQHPDDPGRVRVRICDPIYPRDIPADVPVEDVMRRLLGPFEEAVRAAPAQWSGLVNANRRLARGGDGGSDDGDDA